MSHITHLLRASAVAAALASLAACGTTPPAGPAKPTMQSLLTQASQANAAGNKEQAITLWKEGATAYPQDKTPWIHIAQSRYESGKYGEAILAAQEVLVRDPNDTLANSIIATSGLRLSTRALADLSRQNHLSGSVKTEAQDLAKLLRESLNDPGPLFSPPPAAPAREAERVVRKSPARGKKAAAAAANDDISSADPFKSLK